MDKVAVERSIWIDAPRERVWKAITEAEQLGQWFAPGCTWEISGLKVGGIVKFYDTPSDVMIHTIEVVDPPREFALRWEEPGETPASMLTTFRLTDENGGTRVTVIEEGFEALPAEVRQKRVDQTGQGYSMSMDQLKKHVEGQNG